MKSVFGNLFVFCLCTGPVLAVPDNKLASGESCQSLGSTLIEQVDGAHYAKPDGDNALQTLIEINKRICEPSLDEKTAAEVLQGALVTFEYLGRLDRHREQCPMLDQLAYFKKTDEDKRLFAAFKILYCFDQPASVLPDDVPRWTQYDTDKIHDQIVTAKPVAAIKEKMWAAFKEQRLYSPSGDNAVEYALQIRMLAHAPDSGTESALMDLTPYLIIAAEQASGRANKKEFYRLLGLLRQVDSRAPSLQRLDAIARKFDAQ
ncbi:MAG: hypothetical protein ACREPB_09750 [Arenimonas sp.]